MKLKSQVTVEVVLGFFLALFVAIPFIVAYDNQLANTVFPNGSGFEVALLYGASALLVIMAFAGVIMYLRPRGPGE